MAKITKVTATSRILALELSQEEWNTVVFALRCVNFEDIVAQCPAVEIVDPVGFDELSAFFESELE